MLKLVVQYTIRSGDIDKFLALAKEMAEETYKEKGCKEYDYYQQQDNKNRITLLETWESQEDLDAHINAPHFKRLVPLMAECSAEETIMAKFDRVI